jgi:hypothetical protein
MMPSPSAITFFPRPPKLPVLIMDPKPILAAHTLKGLARLLTRIAEHNPTVRTISLAGGDGTAFTYESESGFLMRSFGRRNIWTKREIVQTYNATCVDDRDRYTYSLPNRSLPQVVVDVATLLRVRS